MHEAYENVTDKYYDEAMEVFDRIRTVFYWQLQRSSRKVLCRNEGRTKDDYFLYWDDARGAFNHLRLTPCCVPDDEHPDAPFILLLSVNSEILEERESICECHDWDPNLEPHWICNIHFLAEEMDVFADWIVSLIDLHDQPSCSLVPNLEVDSYHGKYSYPCSWLVWSEKGWSVYQPTDEQKAFFGEMRLLPSGGILFNGEPLNIMGEFIDLFGERYFSPPRDTNSSPPTRNRAVN